MYQMVDFGDEVEVAQQEIYDDYYEEDPDQPPVLDAHASVSYEAHEEYYEEPPRKRKAFDDFLEDEDRLKYMGIPDYDPEEFEHTMPEEEGMPYCDICERVIKSWNSYEYHMLSKHLNYKPYRCLICGKDHEFYTEDEGRYHMRMIHANVKDTPLIKVYDREKDAQMLHLFENVMRMRDESDGLNQIVNDVNDLENSLQMPKFQKMKFGLPMSVLEATIHKEVDIQCRIVTPDDKFRDQQMRANNKSMNWRRQAERDYPQEDVEVEEEVIDEEEAEEQHQSEMLVFTAKVEPDTEQKAPVIVENQAGPSDRHYCAEELDDNVLS